MYEELIKRLRASIDGRNEKCDGCPYEEDYPCCVDCLDKMHKQAADAIEELSKRARPVSEIEKIIESLQEQADIYNARAQELLVEEDGQVSQYTWAVSLRETYRRVIKTLDDLIS